MRNSSDPDGMRLPVKIDSTSNGEFVPKPLEKRNLIANALAHERAEDHARHIGLDRRSFLVSACGAASTFLAINEVNAAAGKTGGFFNVTGDAEFDQHLAAENLGKKEFIFDIQGHYVNPEGAWLKGMPEAARPLSNLPNAQCDVAGQEGGCGYLQCFSADSFIKDIFLDSDTDMMVLSFVPSRRDREPLTIEEADATRAIIDEMEGNHRLLIHGRVNPNQDGDLDGMDELAERWNIAAWKTYTQWGPDGKGFYLSDEDTGIPFIEKARALGINNICVHKGLAFGPRSWEHSLCTDIGVVAKRYPDMNFIVYHSGLDTNVPEQAFQPGAGRAGIDALVQSLIDNDVAPNSNVYAELGSTWRMLMRDPDQAAHAMGKLFRHVGENNVLWGTDSVWYGSPQDQIQAFRIFEISEEYQEKYGYTKITPDLRARVFGLNATKPYGISAEEVKKRAAVDTLSRQKQAYLESPDPHFKTFGPKTRREFMTLLRNNGGGQI